MYAVVRIAGKQFQVRPETRLRVPRLAAEVGSDVEFTEVLAYSGEGDEQTGLTVGAPLLQGARVTARVLEQARDRKILVFHKKRRKDYRKKNGHRQPYSEIRITGIQMP
jgi:large subunit ribosomal protein L21